MRVLIAASIYPPDPGGPALHANKLYNELVDKGYEPRLAVLSHFIKWPRWIRHLFFLFTLLKEAKGSFVLYAYDAWGTGFPALITSKLLRKKLIVRVGGDMAWERYAEKEEDKLSMNEWYRNGGRNNFFYFTKFLLTNADKIIVPSELLSKVYKKYYGVAEEKIVVIPNPVPQSVETIPYEIPRTIVFASRLVAYKNLKFVLSVLSRVLPEYPDVKFVIMGDGPERNFLETRAKAHGIGDQVVFTGNISRDEVKENISRSYIGLAPALTEFNPNYILECLAFGKPVLVSKENGMSIDLPSEFIFDPRDEKDFEKQLRFLLSHEGYRLAEELVKKIELKTTWGDNLKRNLEILESL